MDLDDLFMVFRRRWRIGALSALAVFLGLVLAAPAIPARYRSECKVLLRPGEAGPVAGAAALLPGLKEIGQRVERRLRLLGDCGAPSADAIAGRIEVKRFEGTPCLVLSAWDRDPLRSPRLLNLFVEQAAGMYAEWTRAGLAPAIELVPIQLASAVDPASLALGRFPGLAAAAVISLLAGGALALLREGLAGRVFTPLDLVRRLGLPVLASIPRVPGTLEGRKAAGRSGARIHRPEGEERFDSAAKAILRRCDGARALLLVHLTVPDRIPAIAAGLEQALVRKGIGAGVVEDGRLLEEALLFHPLVIIDGAPSGPTAEELSLAQRVDGIILIAHAGRTRLDSLAEARKSFSGAGGDVLGAILVGGDREMEEAHLPVRTPRRARRPAVV